MIVREFKINKISFRKRKLTLLQHKLRVVMKCYTIHNFLINDENNSFSFQKTFKKSGIQIIDSTINTGKFNVIDLDESNEIILQINVD